MCLSIATHNRIIAVHTFYHSSFGAFLDQLFRGLFSKPSHYNFLLLSLGFVFAFSRHSIASYLWRAGAASIKHFTRFYVFFGAPCYQHLDLLFQRIILAATAHVPADEPLLLRFDETTCKKSGRQIEGASTFRNGAGSARQEYRTLWGLNFVIGEIRIRLTPWPQHLISVPIGLRLYLKQAQADDLKRSYYTRSQLARQMLDHLCRCVGPTRRVRTVQDGGYSTKAFLRGLPEQVEVVGRLPINSPLYDRPAARKPGQRGRSAKKGRRLGHAKTLAEAAAAQAWHEHPEEAGAELLSVTGLWHSVLPGVWLHVVIVRRRDAKQGQKALEAFFTNGQALSAAQVLAAYRGRWSVEILLREARAVYGLGQDRCRRYERIVGVNGFRLVVGAAEVLWFAAQVKEAAVELAPQQPWYKQKQCMSLYDIRWAVRERLLQSGIMPTVGFWQGVGGKKRSQAEGPPLPMARAA